MHSPQDAACGSPESTSSARSEQRAPRPWLLVSAACVLLATVYIGSLDGGFLWDDTMLLENVSALQDFGQLSSVFTRSFWQGAETGARVADFYRPLTTLSYILDTTLYGANPVGFHLTNLLLHLGCLAQLYNVLRTKSVPATTAVAIALAWSVLPRLAESVAWVSGRTDVLAALLGLSALRVWSKDDATPLKVSLGCAFGLGSLLAKEVGLAFFAGMLWQSLLRAKGARYRLTEVLALSATLAGYFLLRWFALSGIEASLPPEQSLMTRVTLTFEAFGRYVYMFFNPFSPATQIGLQDYPNHTWALAGVLALVSTVGLVLRNRAWLLSARRVWAPACALLLVSLSLVLHLVRIPVNVVAADRFLYVPTLGIALLVGPWVRLTSLRPANRTLAIAVFVAFVGACGSKAHFRSLEWSDELKLWEVELREGDPRNLYPLRRLGHLYAARAMYPEALEALVRGQEARVQTANLAVVLRRMGHCRPSVDLWSRLLASERNLTKTQREAAVRSALCAGRHDLAAAWRAQMSSLGLESTNVSEFELEVDRAEAAVAGAKTEMSAEELEHCALSFTRLGRDPEAIATWERLAAASDADEAHVARATLFLLKFAPLESAAQAVLIARQRQIDGLEAIEFVYAERREATGRLVELFPLVEARPIPPGGARLLELIPVHGPR